MSYHSEEPKDGSTESGSDEMQDGKSTSNSPLTVLRPNLSRVSEKNNKRSTSQRAPLAIACISVKTLGTKLKGNQMYKKICNTAQILTHDPQLAAVTSYWFIVYSPNVHLNIKTPNDKQPVLIEEQAEMDMDTERAKGKFTFFRVTFPRQRAIHSFEWLLGDDIINVMQVRVELKNTSNNNNNIEDNTDQPQDEDDDDQGMQDLYEEPAFYYSNVVLLAPNELVYQALTSALSELVYSMHVAQDNMSLWTKNTRPINKTVLLVNYGGAIDLEQVNANLSPASEILLILQYYQDQETQPNTVQLQSISNGHLQVKFCQKFIPVDATADIHINGLLLNAQALVAQIHSIKQKKEVDVDAILIRHHLQQNFLNSLAKLWISTTSRIVSDCSYFVFKYQLMSHPPPLMAYYTMQAISSIRATAQYQAIAYGCVEVIVAAPTSFLWFIKMHYNSIQAELEKDGLQLQSITQLITQHLEDLLKDPQNEPFKRQLKNLLTLLLNPLPTIHQNETPLVGTAKVTNTPNSNQYPATCSTVILIPDLEQAIALLDTTLAHFGFRVDINANQQWLYSRRGTVQWFVLLLVSKDSNTTSLRQYIQSASEVIFCNFDQSQKPSIIEEVVRGSRKILTFSNKNLELAFDPITTQFQNLDPNSQSTLLAIQSAHKEMTLQLGAIQLQLESQPALKLYISTWLASPTVALPIHLALKFKHSISATIDVILTLQHIMATDSISVELVNVKATTVYISSPNSIVWYLLLSQSKLFDVFEQFGMALSRIYEVTPKDLEELLVSESDISVCEKLHALKKKISTEVIPTSTPRLVIINSHVEQTPVHKPLSAQIPWKEINLGPKIGEGAFADVFLGDWANQKVVLKKLHRSSNYLNDVVKEAEALRQLQHKHIVNFIGVSANEETKEVMLVMEYMKEGSLRDLLETSKVLKESEAIQLALDVAKGLNYLHSLEPKIIHRDLHSGNVMLFANHQRAKIIDFGTARVIDEESRAKTVVGTINFMAPEMLDESSYDEKADVYSFGALLFEMLTAGRMPIQEAKRIASITAKVSDKDLAQLIISCCKTDPKQRPSMSDCVDKLWHLKHKQPSNSNQDNAKPELKAKKIGISSVEFQIALNNKTIKQLTLQRCIGEKTIVCEKLAITRFTPAVVMEVLSLEANTVYTFRAIAELPDGTSLKSNRLTVRTTSTKKEESRCSTM